MAPNLPPDVRAKIEYLVSDMGETQDEAIVREYGCTLRTVRRIRKSLGIRSIIGDNRKKKGKTSV